MALSFATCHCRTTGINLEAFRASTGYLTNFMKRAGVEMWCVFAWLPFIELICSMIDGEEDINPLHTALEVVGYVREFRSVVDESDFTADEIATGDWYKAAGEHDQNVASDLWEREEQVEGKE